MVSIYIYIDISPPQTVRLPTGFPQFDGSVFAAGAVEFSVWGEADGPDGAVVTFLDFCWLGVVSWLGLL